MPYLPSDAEKKSELYNKIINANRLELSSRIENLKKQQNISGSIDANTPLSDNEGFLVSFESEEAGVALEESFQDVRLEKAQSYFILKSWKWIYIFVTFQKSQTDDSIETTETPEEVSDEEAIEFQMTNRDFLIQFINEYFSVKSLTSIWQTKLLHSKIKQFFMKIEMIEKVVMLKVGKTLEKIKKEKLEV